MLVVDLPQHLKVTIVVANWSAQQLDALLHCGPRHTRAVGPPELPLSATCHTPQVCVLLVQTCVLHILQYAHNSRRTTLCNVPTLSGLDRVTCVISPTTLERRCVDSHKGERCTATCDLHQTFQRGLPGHGVVCTNSVDGHDGGFGVKLCRGLKCVDDALTPCAGESAY